MDAVDAENSSRGEAGEEEKNNKKKKAIVVILVGAPGSGKSTFCDLVMQSSSRPWVRICQDTIGNGKPGTKMKCLTSAATALKEGKSVLIDRCNLDREQRSDFLKFGGSHQVDIHAVVLDLPSKLCISRSVKRTGHEGKLQGGRAAAVVNKMLQNKELPTLSEGFYRITFCQNENDVQSAITTYSELGPLETLPSGCFGMKNPNAKVQLGIMRFLKKVEPNLSVVQDSNLDQIGEKRDQTESVSASSLETVPTLAFPSISTADFQFDLEKASDIIVEKVEEFVNKNGNGMLVLVDLSPRSKILALVKAKAEHKNIDSNKFCTFVGDITRLYSEGGLRCNVIANAANWRLKPGGGGVNAAIYNAAGPELDIETKKQAKSLTPGKAIVVPLPSTSPLFIREKISHVIHVLGPNMNPQRPNCLNNDYIRGSKVLREAYTSLFEGFASILVSQEKFKKKEVLGFGLEKSQNSLEMGCMNQSSSGDQKAKREDFDVPERNKKYKDLNDENSRRNMNTGWNSWAQALYRIAMDPERHKEDVLEISDEIVVLNDLYPKAQQHLLVLARSRGLDRLADVRREHLQLLRTMHAVGSKWAEKFINENDSLVFRLGYHLAPSMRQLHLHVISQDFDSKHLKNKKHWNSFTSLFFRDSMDVIEDVAEHGKPLLREDEDDRYLLMELRCQRCRSAHPNIPRLKSHISNCRSPFPAALLNNGRLLFRPRE